MNYDELYILWRKAVENDDWDSVRVIGKLLDLMRANNIKKWVDYGNNNR